ncbi:hypothetical protein HYALB_00011982 [Hymenoscyphus albidus]|uniref:Carrier domain-containing protein n=1 Tax=Hymenoscyphus albidus TaxID=595503 RepID=A0A9N9Q4C8_9HELO|nr:hypothetical protein HYALB_00011982 [Hymenoscyphus albidus]
MRPEAEILTVLERKPAWFFESFATYLISGGLGGIGRSIARRMAQRGVKHLILLSRFGPRTEAAHTLLRELQDLGVEVEILVADIADGPLPKGKLSELSRRIPPIKGCIQSSMVLADCPFESMSYSQWRTAIEPKVQGTFNLHTILPKGMDLFLMLSSIGGAIGSTTQANYAAGCSYQDTLAHHRVSVGEKATTFDLGFMLDDGVLTENSKMMTILKRTGYLVGITQQELYALLEHHCNPSQGLSTPLKTQVVIGIDVPASLKAKSIRTPVFMRRPPFRHFYNMRSALPSKGDDDKSNKESNELSISKVLASVKSLEEAAGKISHSLMAKLSRALAIPAENLDSSKAMHTYGVDSLVAVELRNWFVQTLDADVAIFELLGNATFQDIGVLVAGKSRLVLELLNNSQKGEDDKAA